MQPYPMYISLPWVHVLCWREKVLDNSIVLLGDLLMAGSITGRRHSSVL